MTPFDAPALVSVHGGHSGEFCTHARDSLEGIIKAYIDRGFEWVGITEHMPPLEDRYLYPEEVAAGLNAARIYERFQRYIKTCRELQHLFSSRIQVFLGFETETYDGTEPVIKRLLREFKPDYIVGSVHHVADVGFDYSPNEYNKAVELTGSLDTLYCQYFDAQYKMITALQPQVVGHFDLIRIFDNNYQDRMKKSDISKRIRRNLETIAELDLILDMNMRALYKGAAEPYPTRPILEQAIELGIPIAPGDDSHGVDTVGLNVDKGIELLAEMGAETRWRKPAGR